MTTKEKDKVLLQETGRKGGEATLKKYGKKHYQKLAKKRWEKEKENNDKKS